MTKKTSLFHFRLLWKLMGAITIVFLISLAVSLAFIVLNLQGIVGAEELAKIKNQIITAGILVLVFFTFAAFSLAEAILSPLRRIIEMAKKISRGDGHIMISVNSQDELQDLAKIFNDLTAKFHETIERERALSEMKSEFLRITSHQLRTPLSAIKWAFDIILGGDTGEISLQQRELLMKAYRKNEALIVLIKDVLDVVRIEEGKFEHNPEKGQLEDLLEEVINELLPVARERGVILDFEKPLSPLSTLVFDFNNIKLALQNIVVNAIHYTPRDGKVTVLIKGGERKVSVEVKDTGIGIPKDQLPKLFTKFFRASNAVRLETEGNGLGLFIVKNIIEKHNGKIMVKSEEGKGTSVSVSLPIPRQFIKSGPKRYHKFIQKI